MTVQELEQVEKNMRSQWHDLVIAEQEGAALETLEQMYDTYILLAEEFNRCSEEYGREQQRVQNGRGPLARGGQKQPFLDRERQQKRDDIKLAS
jgi:hypothetical protein